MVWKRRKRVALCKNQGKRQSGKEQIQEDVSEYLLLGLYAGTALRFPTPRTHLLVLVWMEKAHPLCAAHVVPVQKNPRVEILILRKKKKQQTYNQNDDLPFCTNHRAESFGAFERVGEIHPAAVFTRQLWFLLFFCRKPEGMKWHEITMDPKVHQHTDSTMFLMECLRDLSWITHWQLQWQERELESFRIKISAWICPKIWSDGYLRVMTMHCQYLEFGDVDYS